MKRKQTGSIPAVGAGSLITIFALLCLTVFALLSISTLQADTRLSQTARQATLDYYEADFEAQKVLAGLRRGACPDEVTRVGDVYSYTCPISATQQLQVQVRVQGTDYEILRWQAVPVGQWVPADDLPVWNGN